MKKKRERPTYCGNLQGTRRHRLLVLKGAISCLEYFECKRRRRVFHVVCCASTVQQWYTYNLVTIHKGCVQLSFVQASGWVVERTERSLLML